MVTSVLLSEIMVYLCLHSVNTESMIGLLYCQSGSTFAFMLIVPTRGHNLAN